ncbi:hypothetical protein D3C78_1762830 [compost metagenome]
MDHGNRAIGAIVGSQFVDDFFQMIDPQVNRHGRPVLRQAAQFFPGGHRAFVGVAGEDQALGYVRQGQFGAQQGGTG